MRAVGRRLRLGVLLTGISLGAALAGLGGAVTPARATTPDQVPPVGLRLVTRTYEAAMTVTGIDPTLAAKAGNRVRTENGDTVLYDGRTGLELARVPAARRPTVGPLNTVRGNCGTSYITITWLGTNRYNVWTGFHLNRIAIGWSWGYSVRADDNRGVYDDSWDDADAMVPKHSWSFSKTTTTDHRGDTHVARVTKGIAFVPNGVICTSGYPTDAIYIPR